MKKTIIISFSILFASYLSVAQNQGNIWYFGEGAGLDFNGGSPVPITGGQIYANPQAGNEFKSSEGSTVISDRKGNLLFYSNGEKVWNRNHAIMPNGDSLMGMYSSTHPALIVPLPWSDSLFYVFTTDGIERKLANGLRYSVVNLCLDGGLGDVSIGKKNIPLLDTVCEKLTAINHDNRKDIWLIAHKYNSDAFYAYQITENGIVNTVISNIGSVHKGIPGTLKYFAAIGQMKASPDGKRIALVFSNTNPAVAEVFDFDNTTGILSNPISLLTDFSEYGVEFSPDNTKLYITNNAGLQQFDLTAGGGTQTAINASKTNIPLPFINSLAGLQLGPDNKIYMSRLKTYIAAITNPNAPGVSCNYVDSAIDFGTIKPRVSFPSFVQGFKYHNCSYSCAPTGLNGGLSYSKHSVYPNPTTSNATLEFENPEHLSHTLMLYDSQGKLIQIIPNIRTDKLIIEMENLNRGLYLFRLYDDKRLRIAGKLTKE